MRGTAVVMLQYRCNNLSSESGATGWTSDIAPQVILVMQKKICTLNVLKPLNLIPEVYKKKMSWV